MIHSVEKKTIPEDFGSMASFVNIFFNWNFPLIIVLIFDCSVSSLLLMLFSSCNVQTFHFSGFSLLEITVLEPVSSVDVVSGLCCTALLVVMHGLSWP